MEDKVIVVLGKEDFDEIVRLHDEAHTAVATKNILKRMVDRTSPISFTESEGKCLELFFALTTLIVASGVEDEEAVQIEADSEEELLSKLHELFEAGESKKLRKGSKPKTHAVVQAGKQNSYFHYFIETLPEWVNYIAMDETGEIWAFNKKPHISNDGLWEVDDENELFAPITDFVYWTETLTERNPSKGNA